MRNILFDEKIFGSVHLALGNAYEKCDNGNRSSIHWDLVKIFGKGSRVSFDGKPVMVDGRFVHAGAESAQPAAAQELAGVHPDLERSVESALPPLRVSWAFMLAASLAWAGLGLFASPVVSPSGSTAGTPWTTAADRPSACSALLQRSWLDRAVITPGRLAALITVPDQALVAAPPSRRPPGPLVIRRAARPVRLRATAPRRVAGRHTWRCAPSRWQSSPC